MEFPLQNEKASLRTSFLYSMAIIRSWLNFLGTTLNVPSIKYRRFCACSFEMCFLIISITVNETNTWNAKRQIRNTICDVYPECFRIPYRYHHRRATSHIFYVNLLNFHPFPILAVLDTSCVVFCPAVVSLGRNLIPFREVSV